MTLVAAGPAETMLADAVSERRLEAVVGLAVWQGELVDTATARPDGLRIRGNGKLAIGDSCAELTFRPGETDRYHATVSLPAALLGNGVSVALRLAGWEDIAYLAIGHTHEQGFRHVKIVNPLQGQQIAFAFGYGDLVFRIQNGWEAVPPTAIGDIRVYVRGRPAASGATIEIAGAAAWRESTGHYEAIARQVWPEANSAPVFERLRRYVADTDTAATNMSSPLGTAFMRTGRVQMASDIALDWPLDEPVPPGLGEATTYRYLWHALQPALVLIHGARAGRDDFGWLFAARDFVTAWLERSFFSADPDLKYAWYDHGTAERLLLFLLMLDIGNRHGFDARFMSRLRLAIYRHGQLLASDAFYAAHQRTRYHNHAWFQDIALIAAGIVCGGLPCGSQWVDRGIRRLEDQLARLVARDGAYAIFVENSIGYHQGAERLLGLAADLVEISGAGSSIGSVAEELARWTKLLRYPDGRAPAQGDTFRRPNPEDAAKLIAGRPWSQPGCTLLPHAGYAVVRGHHEGQPFMLCLFASSLGRTHKHEDNLSLTLFYAGIEWLIDPSFKSHEYESPVPAYLRSAAAHCNVVLPGLSYSIEPGTAELTGRCDGADYEIEGVHRCYERHSVTRRLVGEVERLRLQARDAVEAMPGAATVGLLVFHLGDGVRVAPEGDAFVLSHPATERRLRLVVPGTNPEIVSGWQEGRRFQSVAGGGFMQQQDTTSLVFRMPAGHLEWTIAAVDG